jgi:ankyrin repeat protein
MSQEYVIRSVIWAWFSSVALTAQVGTKVDFSGDVQPIFHAHCVGCHGPSQQMNNFRLDRRGDAMRGGTGGSVIGPGNSDGSVLYLRLIGNQHGPQMPPAGSLNAEQIRIIKTWIDQGAHWPDDVSGEKPLASVNPTVMRLADALREGDRLALKKALNKDPNIANVRGQGGSTLLMYAALYGTSDSLRTLLLHGADPNIRNDAGATPLMWATDDLEKTRLLLNGGADPNARSDDGRTPLLIAASRFGSGAVVKLLIDHGAKVAVKSSYFLGEVTPVSEAAYSGDESLLRMLLQRGADVKDAGFLPLYFAMRNGCAKCVDLLMKFADRDVLNKAMLFIAPPEGDAHSIITLLDRGADVNARGPEGRTILMLAASSDRVSVESIKTLIERGADVNVRSGNGKTALDFARQHGEKAIVKLLEDSNAKGANESDVPKVTPKQAGSPRAALERSIPLLQRTDITFMQKSGCVSCHNNTLTAMAIAAAQRNGIPVAEKTAQTQLNAIASNIDSWRERVLQGIPIPGDADTVSYILVGMAAANYPPDRATDALARFLKNRQSPDGRWWILGHRPPLESSDIALTATSMHAIQVYAPKSQRAEYEKAIQLAATWLMKAKPSTNEDRAFQLLGFVWGGVNKALIGREARELLAAQRPDGGWSQIPSLATDAYATGQALVSLKEAGALTPSAAAYQRGIHFLLTTQYEDGSWHVKSRSIPFMPFFESDFPHGPDQWISAAATNWATMALAPAAK